MSSPGRTHRAASTAASSRHLSPNPSTSTFDQSHVRGRSSSTGLTSGRKGYNASQSPQPNTRSASTSPAPSGLSPHRHSRSNSTASGSHRSLLGEPSARHRASSDGLTGRKGYNASGDGVEGRKGFNAENEQRTQSRSPSRSRSREPRHQGLGSRAYFNSPLNPAREQSPAPAMTPAATAVQMERERSGSQGGLTGRKGYNASHSRSNSSNNNNACGEWASARSSSRSEGREGLTGRKGYNGPASPQPPPSTNSNSSSPRPDRREGLTGRKGYNSPLPSPQPSPKPQPSSNGSSPRSEGLGGRKGYNGSPKQSPDRRNSQVEQEGYGLGLGIAMGAGRGHEGLGGRKGFNGPNPGH